MIFERSLLCRGFALCYGSFVPGEVLLHSNAGDGVANQATYLYFGNVTISQNGTSIELLPKQVNDMSTFMGSPYEAVAGNSGVAWVAVNPIPCTKKYDIKVLEAGNSVIESNTQECIILCIEGSIECNSKVLNKLQYARVPNGSSVNLNISGDSVALLMTA